MKRLLWTLGGAVVLAAFAAPAHAVLTTSFSFDCITNNSAGQCAIGESQLSMDVSGEGSDPVAFRFLNEGSDPASITDIYFDLGTPELLLLAGVGINQSGGVAFSLGASPPDLSGGNNASPPFVTTPGFSFDSDPPTSPNGVNPTEWVEIVFNLSPGRTYDDVINQLGTGELRVGIHVQAIGTGDGFGGSESFVNSAPIPEPGTLLLLGAGLTGLALRRRRSTP